MPPAVAQMLVCLRAAHVPSTLTPARRQPDAAEARALLDRPEPACRILGALAPSERGDAALEALAALPRTSAAWRPLIDAARNVITLEGVVSGRVHVAPGRSDAYGDPEEQRATLTPGIAMEIERLGELAQWLGHLWLVDRVRLPALEALGEAYHGVLWRPCVRVNLRDSPLLRPGTYRPVDARWVDYLNDGYRLAVASFEDAQRHDPRFDDVWRRRLLAGRERARLLQDQSDFWRGADVGGGIPWGLRSDTWSGVRALRFGGIDESTGRPDPNLDVARVERATRALYADDRLALLAALGARTRASLRVATIAWALAGDLTRPWIAAWAAPPLTPQVGALRLRRYDHESVMDGRGRTPPHELWGVASDPAHRGTIERDDLGDLDLDDPFAAAILDMLQRHLQRTDR